jgi:hypothetical protein
LSPDLLGTRQPAGRPDGELMVRRRVLRPLFAPGQRLLPSGRFTGCSRVTQRSTRKSDRLEQPHGSIRMELRMARISATSFRGALGDQFASITRRVPSTSRIQKSSVRPGSAL